MSVEYLPVTTDRSGFIVDSPQYQAFRKTMKKVIAEVDKVLKRLTGPKEKKKTSKALKEARDVYPERDTAHHARDLIDEGPQKPTSGVCQTEQTPSGCLHRFPSWLIFSSFRGNCLKGIWPTKQYDQTIYHFS
jgi:hypothetical protein